MTPHNLLPSGGEVYYFPQAFDKNKSDAYFQLLLDRIHWKQEPVKIFGKEVMQPRLTAWYGDTDKPYTYSGLTMTPNKWIHPLPEIKAVADHLSGVESTSALLNLYRDGNDGLGWHRDNEKVLGHAPVIASVSFGMARKFQFRNYHDKSQVISIMLEPGSVLVMKGASQQEWQHRIPKTTRLHGARINITFRVIGSSPGA